MSFAHPWVLAAALPCALLLFAAYRLAERRRSGQTLRYSNLAFLVHAARPRAWPRRALMALWICAVLFVAVSVAHPRVLARIPVRGGAVMLCVDTSGSMAAQDVQPTRAGAALSAMRSFIGSTAAGTAIGILSFSGGAQLLTPPVRDRDRIEAALQAVPGPNGATAIGDALALAQHALPKTGRRAVVLITDGENNLGSDPLQAARSLGARGITLYTVGIGTSAGALIPGTLQTAGIDEDALRAYAQATGGVYSRAGDAPQLREALAQLGRTTGFERATVDISLATAVTGALLLALTFLGGVWTKSI